MRTPYSFVAECGDAGRKSSPELVEALKGLVAEITYLSQVDFRSRYNGIRQELNRRGEICPLALPRVPAPKFGEVRDDLDNAHVLDLQVLDCDWLFMRDPRRPITQSSEAIFANGQFDLRAAEAFATLPWPMTRKAQALLLGPEEEWQTAVIHRPGIMGQLRRWEKFSRRIEAMVIQASRRSPALLACRDWGRLWLAGQIVTKGFAPTPDAPFPASPAEIARMFALMTGTAQDGRVVAKRWSRMQTFLKSRGWEDPPERPQ